MEHIIEELRSNWYLKEVSKDLKYSAAVPGTVYETLFENNAIKDPFYGTNEEDCQWVYQTEWEYSTIINVSKEIEKRDFCLLKFHGLDTFCEVLLNDRVILFGDNMHRTYDVYIKTKEYNYLVEENNKLTVRFKSPVKEAQDKLKEEGLQFDLNRENLLPFALPGVEMLRKAYFSFGWDWGPKLPDSGIWRKVELHGFNEAVIKNVHIQTDIDFIIGEGDGKTTAKKAEITIETDLVDFNEKGGKTLVYEVYDGNKLVGKKKFD